MANLFDELDTQSMAPPLDEEDVPYEWPPWQPAPTDFPPDERAEASQAIQDAENPPVEFTPEETLEPPVVEFTPEETLEQPEVDAISGAPVVPFQQPAPLKQPQVPQGVEEEPRPLTFAERTYQASGGQLDPERIASDRAAMDAERTATEGERLLEGYRKFKQEEQDALDARRRIEEGVRKRQEGLYNTLEALRNEPATSFAADAGVLGVVGALVAATTGGWIAGKYGGPNHGLNAVLHIVDSHMEAKAKDRQARMGALDRQLSVLDRLMDAGQDEYAARVTANMHVLGVLDEEIDAYMKQLEPETIAYQKAAEMRLGIRASVAEKEREFTKWATEKEIDVQKFRIQEERQAAADVETARHNRRTEQLTYRNQNLDTTYKYDALAAAREEKAMQLESEHGKAVAEDYRKNALNSVTAVDKNGKRFTVFLREGAEQQAQVVNALKGREVVKKSIGNLKRLAEKDGLEFWGTLQQAERQQLIAAIGALKGFRQMTAQEMDLATKLQGRPPGWLVGELRKNNAALDQLSKNADDEIQATLRANVRGGLYQGMHFEIDETPLSPQGRAGFGPLPRLEFSKEASEHIWKSEDDRVRIASIMALDKNFAKDKGQGLPHIERATQDSRNVVRGIAADALGRHGDPDSLSIVERLAAEDPDETVRKRALKAANKIRARFPEESKAKDPAERPEAELPPGYLSGAEGVGASVSGSRLSVEEIDERKRKALGR